jgi:hypothetical protein
MTQNSIKITKDESGRLHFIDDQGATLHDVSLLCAFPLSSPDKDMAVLNAEGVEVGWIASLSTLEPEVRQLVEQKLLSMTFIPEISRVLNISGYEAPCDWFVDTNRGVTRFTLLKEEDVQHFGNTSILITDNNEMSFIIKDINLLDKYSRKVIDRFKILSA